MTQEEVVTELIELLDKSSNKRLEIFRSDSTGRVSGYCTRDDGNCWYIKDVSAGNSTIHRRRYA
jgi:hypothetical protein